VRSSSRSSSCTKASPRYTSKLSWRCVGGYPLTSRSAGSKLSSFDRLERVVGIGEDTRDLVNDPGEVRER
jgi:hypothetical protein